MTDRNDDQPDPAAAEVPGETSVQRALRLKNAKIDARPKPPRGGKFQREQAARIATGKSKPWMSR
ncbi:hypothetical protein [Brevundimonas lenta]|uniref:Uncharacterized protein n=1 Tax=Brevundimonas lenta TaxID=424796 RepID=A0A7W6JFY1_9CAUL|nr:hypothetical protein [Brevundimonas lenta]MBB4084428.1 hypothetical protein [Brevundimonas lenta]